MVRFLFKNQGLCMCCYHLLASCVGWDAGMLREKLLAGRGQALAASPPLVISCLDGKPTIRTHDSEAIDDAV